MGIKLEAVNKFEATISNTDKASRYQELIKPEQRALWLAITGAYRENLIEVDRLFITGKISNEFNLGYEAYSLDFKWEPLPKELYGWELMLSVTRPGQDWRRVKYYGKALTEKMLALRSLACYAGLDEWRISQTSITRRETRGNGWAKALIFLGDMVIEEVLIPHIKNVDRGWHTICAQIYPSLIGEEFGEKEKESWIIKAMELAEKLGYEKVGEKVCEKSWSIK